MTASNAGMISKLESQTNEEYGKRCQVMTAEHVEQVQRTEKLEAEAAAEAQASISNEQLVARMRHEHHSILQAEKARHSVVLQEQETAAANDAAEARRAAASALHRSESADSIKERNWQCQSEQWKSEQAAFQDQRFLEATNSLHQQQRESQNMVNEREMIIVGLRDEMLSRDSLSFALSQQQKSEIAFL
eukprot:10128799-Heterocapsa_arctica.AAC.1